MSDTLVRLTLTATVVGALRKLGVIHGETRRCRRAACKSAFIPSDNRQRFCQPSCAKADRQADWLKNKAREAKEAARRERYKPLDFPPDAVIADLPIAKRVKNLCADAGLVTVADVRSRSDGMLLKTPGLGRLALLELRRL